MQNEEGTRRARSFFFGRPMVAPTVCFCLYPHRGSNGIFCRGVHCTSVFLQFIFLCGGGRPGGRSSQATKHDGAFAGLTASCKVFQLVAGAKPFAGLFCLLPLHEQRSCLYPLPCNGISSRQRRGYHQPQIVYHHA